MKFSYRNSIKSMAEAKKKVPKLIEHKMESIKEARWAKQSKDFPNTGSVYKHPEDHFVGTMIDDLELKGFRVGGGKVSEKHSGFIVNYNKAKGEDILNLIKKLKLRVLKKFGIDLVVEQRAI